MSLPILKNLPLLLIVFSFFYVFYPFQLAEPIISADAVFDAQIARNILLGDGLGWQATMQPPLQAILSVLVYPLTKNLLISGILVSKLMWWLLPVAVYFLSSQLFGKKTGIVSAILVFFHPHFSTVAGGIEATGTYTTFLVFGAGFLWRAFSKESFLSAILAGITFALAYLSRSEGFLVFLIFNALLFLLAGRHYYKNRLNNEVRYKKLLILIISFTICIMTSLPYFMFLKNTYGKWVISPKSTYVQIWMKSMVYKDNNLGEQGNPELWGLSRNGKLMWQEPKGLGDLAAYLMSHPKKSLKVYLENFSHQIPGRIPNNSGQWLYPQVYPWYFCLPALLWLVLSFRIPEERRKSFFLLAPFTMLIILPIFTNGWWKYLLPYSVFLIILAGQGITRFTDRLPWKLSLLPIIVVIISYSVWAVKASPHVKHGNKEVAGRNVLVKEQIKAGKWAQARFKGTPNYMSQWTKLAYYLNGRWTAFPVSNYYQMIWYAKKNKVDYIVLETFDKRNRDSAIKSFTAGPYLKVADVYDSSSIGYSAIFFSLK